MISLSIYLLSHDAAVGNFHIGRLVLQLAVPSAATAADEHKCNDGHKHDTADDDCYHVLHRHTLGWDGWQVVNWREENKKKVKIS